MRKNIDLHPDTVEILDWLAKEDGRPTKNYIERILLGHACDYEEAFKNKKKKQSKSSKK